MRKKDELENPNSCLSKAGMLEVMFNILSRDVAAPATVRFWCSERIRLRLNKPGDALLIDAEEWAATMEQEGAMYKPLGRANVAADTPQPADSRAAFEAWAAARSLEMDREDDGYQFGEVQLAWEAWQARREPQSAGAALDDERIVVALSSATSLLRLLESLDLYGEGVYEHCGAIEVKMHRLAERLKALPEGLKEQVETPPMAAFLAALSAPAPSDGTNTTVRGEAR